MMRVLDRLVLGSFFKLFVAFLLATPPLFILGEVTENLDDYVDAGLTVWEVAHGFLYKLPQYLTWSFPIAALIASVFTIQSMTTHREIVAAKAGGISFHRLVAPVLLAGVLLTGAALWLTNLAPRTMLVANQIHANEDRGRDWRADFVYQTEGGMTLSAQRLSVADGRLSDVLLQRPPAEEAPGLWVEANEALWDSAGGSWTLRDGHFRSILGADEVSSMRFERMRVAGLTETPEDLLQDEPEEEEMTYAQLQRLARIIERTGGEPNKLRVRMEQKYSVPVATLVIILFGAPLATSSKRGGAAYGIGVALGTTILYLLLFKIAGGFGTSGAIPAKAAAWFPNVVFFVAGLWLLGRVRT